MDYRDWLANIQSVTKRIADEAYQRRSWFGGGSEVSSPIELYCQLMEDWRLDEFILQHLDSMTREQKEAAFTLARAMEGLDIGSGSDPHAVLEDPNWKLAQQAAAKFLTSFPLGHEKPVR